MTERRKKGKARSSQLHSPDRRGEQVASSRAVYDQACRTAVQGDRAEARRIYKTLDHDASEPGVAALIQNDLAAVVAMGGEFTAAVEGLRYALAIDPQCLPARFNLTFLEDMLAEGTAPREQASPTTTSSPGPGTPAAGRVTILSFFFNSPSTGGGNIVTAEFEQRRACALPQTPSVVEFLFHAETSLTSRL